MVIVEKYLVTPLAGVWVEIASDVAVLSGANVTPLAGVWVEICFSFVLVFAVIRHSPCGSVG